MNEEQSEQHSAQKLVKQFSDDIVREAPDLIKAVVHFGSTTNTKTKLLGSDIDVLLIVDDLVRVMSPEVIQGFRVIVERVASSISPRFHINTMRITQFWEYARKGDPLLVNILREGMIVFDTGVFATAQKMFKDDMIKPTEEVVFSYLSNAPKILNNAKWHVTRAVMSLYWSMLHSAHAALLAHDIVPHAPQQVGDLIEEYFVEPLEIEEHYLDIYRHLEDFMTHIGKREIMTASPQEYDRMHEKVELFNKKMEELVMRKELKI
jgi:uncharacterized protein (UPF0332 family)